MTQAFEDSTTKNTLALEYEDKLRRHEQRIFSSLSGERYDFFWDHARFSDTNIYRELLSAMRAADTVPSQYLSKNMTWLFDTAVSSSDGDAILYFADRLCEYPYSDSYTRRAFRAKDNGAYAKKLVRIIQSFSTDHLNTVNEPLEKILKGELSPQAQSYLDKFSWRGCGYNEWQLAYALDCHESAVEDAVWRILTEENSSHMMTRELIRGILFSHRSDFHELLGALLLAARLQEGLRQVICENADSGTKGAFLAILKVIAENDLIRFSSVKRAVGTWLGILTQDSRNLERISEKSVRLVIDCLDSATLREQYLASEDAMKIYIALWSYAFDDIDEAVGKISDISDNGTAHQLLAAGYFASNLELPYVSNEIAKKVIKRHAEKDEVLAVWLPSFMSTRGSVLWNAMRRDEKFEYSAYFESKSELYEYYQLVKEKYSAFEGKTKTFSPCVFPWYEAKISKSDLAQLLCTMAVLSGDKEKLDEGCTLVSECNSESKCTYFCALMRDPSSPRQRAAAIEWLADRGSDARKCAYNILKKMSLTSEEYRTLEQYLRFKWADIRKYVMELLLGQGDDALSLCICRLLDDKKEDIRLGALDMLLQLKADEKRSKITHSFQSALLKMAKAENLSSKEKLLLDSLLSAQTEPDEQASAEPLQKDKYLPTEFSHSYTQKSCETFAEYFPDSKLPELVLGKKGNLGIFQKIKNAIKDISVCRSCAVAESDLASLSKFIEAHKTNEFVSPTGTQMLLGNVQVPFHLTDQEGNIPFAELWQGWADANGITCKRLVRALVLLLAYKQKTLFCGLCADTVRTVFGVGFEQGRAYAHSDAMCKLLFYLLRDLPSEEKVRLASALAVWFVRCVPEDKVMLYAPTQKNLPVQLSWVHLLSHPQLYLIYQWLDCKNDDNLKNVFPLAVASAQRCMAAAEKIPDAESLRVGNSYYYVGSTKGRSLFEEYDGSINTGKELVGVKEYLYAANQGIITQGQLFDFLLEPINLRTSLETVSSVASVYFEKGRQVFSHKRHKILRNVRDFFGKDDLSEQDMPTLRFVCGVYEAIIPKILDAELHRGDTPTVYTEAVCGIMRIYGAENFCKILSAMGDDPIDRSAAGRIGTVRGRKESLSYLLSVCVPLSEDSPDTLRSSLAEKKVSTKRIIEAALFSPEWISVVGQYLCLDSFESACYYFMAHMNESFDDKRKAMIARFTPLSEDELNLGAFDLSWFHSAFCAIGQEKFNLIYDAAKYIADGAKHSRARRYADASLGKIDVSQTEKLISDKRNKDLLMAYALIPLENEEDLFRRYLFIQGFLKQSRNFGSQRIASEAKAVEMALKNLASNAGYSDEMRLCLRMEARLTEDRQALLQEQIIDGVAFCIELDENGKASLFCKKDGKRLKSVPAALKKNEAVSALSDMVRALREQHSRTTLMLERAMEDGVAFSFAELLALSSHCVVGTTLKKLVLVSDEAVGFLSELGLCDDTGAIRRLDGDAQIKIAHPYELYRRGLWRNYQKYLYENKVAQPFRQVFRELYIKTPEESELLYSLRYAGNQIQPAKTASALKGRRWVADVECGLQKVYYKENIIAHIYALADWFSPADIEAPTLEWVCFENRRTGEKLRIKDVPDVLFSEVMRDVDFAVSVAHAGGVDPETSHSTMEMRAAILSFVLPMFRIANVKIEGHHAIIDGKLAEYSVHLGSGVVHQIGGAMIPVLPVHSQHRGRIFLPFVDDDPKTAEILSKVLLFAEDEKIKDPMILTLISK